MPQDRSSRRAKLNLPDWIQTNFRVLLDAAPDAMIIVNGSGEIVVANSQIETLFGYSRRELGLEICKSNRSFDLLITDVVMPELGGPELAEEAKKLIPRLKIIFMSGYTDRAIDDKLQGSRTEFLQKPVSLDLFARTIRKVLETTSETGQVQ